MTDNTPLIINEDNVLLCPTCGCYNLHQNQIVSVFRDDEDKDGTIVNITRKRIIKKRATSKDIPYRRDAAFVYFTCEECGETSSLIILQHKGCTYLTMCRLKS